MKFGATYVGKIELLTEIEACVEAVETAFQDPKNPAFNWAKLEIRGKAGEIAAADKNSDIEREVDLRITQLEAQAPRGTVKGTMGSIKF